MSRNRAFASMDPQRQRELADAERARSDTANALERLIDSEQQRVDAARAAHPGDHYLGLLILEDIEILRALLQSLRS